MDKRDNPVHPLGICRRLFNFLFDNLVARGLKRVTLGRPDDLPKVLVADASRNGVGSTGDCSVIKPVRGGSVRVPVHGLPMVNVDSQVKVEFVQATRLENSTPIATFGSSSHAPEKDSATEGGNQTPLQKGVNPPLSSPTALAKHQGSTKVISDPKNKEDEDHAPGIRSVPLLEKKPLQETGVHIDPKNKEDKDQAPGISSVPLGPVHGIGVQINPKNKGDGDQSPGSGSVPRPEKKPVQGIGVQVDPKNKGDKDQAPGSGSFPLPLKAIPPIQPTGGHIDSKNEGDKELARGSGSTALRDKELPSVQHNGVHTGVPPSATVSQATAPKKTVGIKESAEEKDMSKKKEKNIQMEKPGLAEIEPDKDVKLRGPRPVRPFRREISNINEKAETFIRQRREAVKKSSGVEPKKS